MTDALSGIARKGLALVILLVAAWFLLKLVVGVVATVVWIAVIVGAVLAALWAWSVLAGD